MQPPKLTALTVSRMLPLEPIPFGRFISPDGIRRHQRVALIPSPWIHPLPAFLERISATGIHCLPIHHLSRTRAVPRGLEHRSSGRPGQMTLILSSTDSWLEGRESTWTPAIAAGASGPGTLSAILPVSMRLRSGSGMDSIPAQEDTMSRRPSPLA